MGYPIHKISAGHSKGYSLGLAQFWLSPGTSQHQHPWVHQRQRLLKFGVHDTLCGTDFEFQRRAVATTRAILRLLSLPKLETGGSTPKVRATVRGLSPPSISLRACFTCEGLRPEPGYRPASGRARVPKYR